jgi:uncharacterized paraquat-inducible protein A
MRSVANTTTSKIKCSTNAAVVTADFKELGMIDETVKAQKLRECDLCKVAKEPRGGVEVRQKWHCARCWVKAMQRGHK